MIVLFPFINNVLDVLTEMGDSRINASIWTGLVSDIFNFPSIKFNVRLDINSSWSSVGLNDFSVFEDLFTDLNYRKKILINTC